MTQVLIVKLSSLGDVVHTLPAVMDLRRAWPHAQVDWVIERPFAPLLGMCPALRRTIPCDLRRWRRKPLAASTRDEWRAFVQSLRAVAYDAVIDLQGLTKSALVARLARLAPNGRRFAMANRTDGSSYEAPTRWVAHTAVEMPAHVDAVRRGRSLMAAVVGQPVPDGLDFGLVPPPDPSLAVAAAPARRIAFLHGASRDDKCWPESHWIGLGQRLLTSGHSVALAHGNDAELARAQRIADALGGGPHAVVWPRMDVRSLAQQLAGCDGAIGVDSGLSHIAVALGLPHVQIYNFDTAWRTGPVAWSSAETTTAAGRRQVSVFVPGETGGPSLETVWSAWAHVSRSQTAQEAQANADWRSVPQTDRRSVPGGLGSPA